VVAAAGGLASQLTGGKFANGALTAAFAYLFNYCAHGGNCFGLSDEDIMEISKPIYQDPAQGKELAIGVAIPFFAPIGEALGVAGSEVTTLYRAVSDLELKSLLPDGIFSVAEGSMEGKWFAESAADAVNWGNKFYPGGNFTVIEAQFPTDVADTFFRLERLDGIGPARYGELDILNASRISVRPFP
jgi:hypothetical protein